MRNRVYSIDFFKYIASILVLASHTSLFAEYHKGIHFLIVQVLCRLAVPFFAVCTGYFFAQNLRCAEDNRIDTFITKTKMSVFGERWIKLILLYSVWSIIYLVYSIPSWIQTGWMSINAFVDYLIGTITQGSHYHLWYLLSIIYAFPFLFICIRYIERKWHVVLAILLYLVKVVTYSYRYCLPKQMKLFLETSDRFGGVFNALFCILPFLLIGSYISGREENNVTVNRYGWKFLISFIFMSMEAIILNKQGATSVSYIIFTFPTAYILFSFLIKQDVKLNDSICRLLGVASVFIYCVHPMLLEVTHLYVKNSIILFVIVTLTSTVLGILYAFRKRKGRRA